MKMNAFRAWGNERLIRMSQEDTKDEYLGRPSKVLMALFWLKQRRLKSSSYSIIIFCRLLFSKRHFTAFSSGLRQTFCGLTSISSSSSNLSKSYLFVWILLSRFPFSHSVFVRITATLLSHPDSPWGKVTLPACWGILGNNCRPPRPQLPPG